MPAPKRPAIDHGDALEIELRRARYPNSAPLKTKQRALSFARNATEHFGARPGDKGMREARLSTPGAGGSSNFASIFAVSPRRSTNARSKAATEPPAAQLNRYIDWPWLLEPAIVTVAIGMLIWLFRIGVATQMSVAGLVLLICIALWTTALLPEILTSLIFIAACMLFAIAPPKIVFSGFLTSAIWLTLGGMMISLAMNKTGLGKQVAERVLRATGDTYGSVLCGVVGIGVLLIPLLPSGTGRVVLLSPILVALANQLGFARGSSGYHGIVVTGIMATAVPGVAILPSHLTNLVMAGSAELLYGIKFSYGPYALLNVPTIGLLSAGLLLGVSHFVFNPGRGAELSRETITPLAASQQKLLAIIVTTVVLCALDFLHGVPPAWIVLTAGILCLCPRIGVVPPAEFREINLGVLIYFASVMGLGAVATHSGIVGKVGDFAANEVDLKGLPAFAQYLALQLLGCVFTLLANDLGAPAIMTSLANQLSNITGWPLQSVLLAQVPTWAILGLPHQSPLLLVGLAMSGVSIRAILKFTTIYFALGWLVLVPTHYVWGHLLGVFP